MQISANGINVSYRIDGPQGAPWLVFSNSLLTNFSMWDEQASHFSAKYRVLRYDQRGHGGTEASTAPYTFGMLIADAVALLDALSIERAHFCGLSMGGVTVMGLTQLHPERVDRAAICDTPCASSPATAQQWLERIEIARKQGIEALEQSTLERWFPAETIASNPQFFHRLRQSIRSTPVEGFAGCAAALADHDFRSAAHKVRNPVLFVAGEKDGAVPAAMRSLHAALPGSQFAELPGAGHISNLDRPQLFNEVLESFLET